MIKSSIFIFKRMDIQTHKHYCKNCRQHSGIHCYYEQHTWIYDCHFPRTHNRYIWRIILFWWDHSLYCKSLTFFTSLIPDSSCTCIWENVLADLIKSLTWGYIFALHQIFFHSWRHFYRLGIYYKNRKNPIHTLWCHLLTALKNLQKNFFACYACSSSAPV